MSHCWCLFTFSLRSLRHYWKSPRATKRVESISSIFNLSNLREFYITDSIIWCLTYACLTCSFISNLDIYLYMTYYVFIILLLTERFITMNISYTRLGALQSHRLWHGKHVETILARHWSVYVLVVQCRPAWHIV